MGGIPWDYFVPYREDIQAALDELRQREFEAGRFRGSEMRPTSYEEAMENSEGQGTASIIDVMFGVSETPDFCAVGPLPREELVRLFGTDKPTREMIKASGELYGGIERGQGVYIIVYADGNPSEIFFGGYSWD